MTHEPKSISTEPVTELNKPAVTSNSMPEPVVESTQSATREPRIRKQPDRLVYNKLRGG